MPRIIEPLLANVCWLCEGRGGERDFVIVTSGGGTDSGTTEFVGVAVLSWEISGLVISLSD